jgi:hypothetical protein
MEAAIFGRHRVIDIDTHVTEPADVWTARVAGKWGEQVPHIRRLDNLDLWMIGDQPVGMPGAYSMAGHDGTPPEFRAKTDFPRPTCQAPGPASAGTHPKLYVEKALRGIDEAVIGKVMHHTAAEIYGLD